MCKGDIFVFFNNLRSEGIIEYLSSAYSRPSLTGFNYILVFGAIEAVFQLCLPGKVFYGPATPKGNVPVYKANGVQAYVATLALFFLGWQ